MTISAVSCLFDYSIGEAIRDGPASLQNTYLSYRLLPTVHRLPFTSSSPFTIHCLSPNYETPDTMNETVFHTYRLTDPGGIAQDWNSYGKNSRFRLDQY
jgi:hypothetical protein